MTIMTQAQVISRWHQEGEKLLLTAVTEDWMRGFILRLQDSSSALRTNSKQTLRKHRFFPLPVRQPGWRSCTPQKDRQPSPRSSEIMSWAILGSSFHLWPQVFLFFSFSFFFASFWDYSSQHTLNRRLSGRFRDECVLNCLFIGG